MDPNNFKFENEAMVDLEVVAMNDGVDVAIDLLLWHWKKL